MEAGGQGPAPLDPERDAQPELERQMALAGHLRATLDVAARLAGARGRPEMSKLAVDAMVDSFGARLAEVWLVAGPTELILAASRGGSVEGRSGTTILDWSSDASLVAEVARTRLPMVTSNLVEPFAPALEGDRPLVGAAVLPVLAGEPSAARDGDQLLGVMAAWFAGAVPVEVADGLAAFATVITAALQRAADSGAGLWPELIPTIFQSLEITTTARNLATAGVRCLADWCTVSVVEDDGDIRRRAVASRDRSKADSVAALAKGFSPVEGIESHVVEALSSRRSQLANPAGRHWGDAGEDYALLLDQLGCTSVITVPLVARDRALGAFTLVSGTRRPPFGREDLALAEELGRHAAVALDHADSHRRLRQHEQHLRSFVDSLGAILWEADPSTFEFSFVSQRAEEVLGYPAQRWLDEPEFWVSRIHPADRDYTVSYRRLATAEGRHHELEYRMVAADGRKVWFQDIVYVDVDEYGHSRLRGVMVDVTQRKRSEQVLLDSRERFASLARTLQASLLPPHLPDILGLEVAARYRPAEDGVEVVGDFYDLFDVGDDGWGVVIGDVCGKGPEAAALTAVARYTVRAAAMRARRPSRVLARLNDAVLHHDADERFCTAAYARVVPAGDQVTVSLACGGHPLPLVLRADGSVEPAGHPGMLLGLFEAPDLVDSDFVLQRGDALVFFTDGATEAKRGAMMLGEERLRALVRACAGLRAEEIAGRLEDALLAFQNGVPQDDLALVVLRVPG